MATITKQAGKKLQEIFRRSNMADLPALSENVQQLIYLTGTPRTSAAQLAEAVLKDYALTNKILQVVNSAYYSRGIPVSSIERAVSLLGFSAIRELALAISLFEDFLKVGADRENISKLITQSMLSALFAKQLCRRKKFNVKSDEAFICAMLYNLGKIVVLIWMPGQYRKIEALIAGGMAEKAATMAVLDDLTYQLIGKSMVAFWNFSDEIVLAMIDDPPGPRDEYDSAAYLQNITVFSNLFLAEIIGENDIDPVLEKYDDILHLGREEAIAMVSHCMEAVEGTSKIYRYGLTKLKLKRKLLSGKLSSGKGDVH